MEYTADMVGAIQYGLSHMGDQSIQGDVKLYSDLVHKDKRKGKSTDTMTSQQIIGYILNKL